MSQTIKEIVSKLSQKQKEAIIRCNRDGNGAHIWAIHSIVKLGLMDLTWIPDKQIEAYRLNDLGYQVRSVLITDAYYESLLTCYYRYLHMSSEPLCQISLDPNIRLLLTEFFDGCQNNMPISKLCRWLGYIQKAIIDCGVTDVETERNATRPLFRHLDYPDGD